MNKNLEPFDNGECRDLELPPEVIPNLDDIVIEDGKPVENVFIEKQQRLLTEPLYSSWPGPGKGRPFLALSNVGLFYAVGVPPLVPDGMLSLDIAQPSDQSKKENRSYFVWLRGKVPEVAIEIVSDRRGGEASHKLREYARIGVPYYVIFDPRNLLKGGVLRVFELRGGNYEPSKSGWLPKVGLGLTLWSGTFENMEGQWLRWCDRKGKVIPTGCERAEQERKRAKNEKKRGNEEKKRASDERKRAEKLRQQLRALGIDPSV
jgi:hypothetical protein